MSITRLIISVSGPNNIPIVAMAAEKNRAAERQLDANTDLSHLIGGNRSRALIGRFGPALRLVERRTTTPTRLAVYSVWIEIDDPAAATIVDVDEMKVLHGVEALRHRAEDELRDLQKKLDAELTQGRFDLSRVAEWERTYRAQEFIDTYAIISKLKDRLSCLEIVSSAYPEA